MASSIPASAIVSVLPSVIDAGGSGLDLIGMFLTDNARMPTARVLSFSSASDVSAYFGPLSTEATMAAIYFAGYDASSIKPATLLFYRYVDTAASAFLRGAPLAITLTQLQALTSGTLSVTVDGSVKTSGSISFSAATSFSNAAAIIQAAFTSPNFTVSWDTIGQAFLFTSNSTGATSTITVATATGGLDALLLGTAAGPTVSQGADVTTPATAMSAALLLTQDFVSFTTTFEPADSDKVAFAVWANGQGERYLYVCWDNNIQATQSGDTASVGSIIRDNAYASVAPVYDPNNGQNVAAFLMGAVASINFAQQDGRASLAFRTSAGNIAAGVTNQSIAAHLIANKYNFVGAYATANDLFTFFYPGQVSGPFDWIDSWVCQVWMNNAFQLALMELLTSAGQIPYNQDGFGMIETALRSVIEDALHFGAIRAGITLSTAQKAEVNNRAGGDVASTIEQRGWYVKVADPGATVRAARGSPVTTVFYTDGQSVQSITLSSINVQ